MSNQATNNNVAPTTDDTMNHLNSEDDNVVHYDPVTGRPYPQDLEADRFFADPANFYHNSPYFPSHNSVEHPVATPMHFDAQTTMGPLDADQSTVPASHYRDNTMGLAEDPNIAPASHFYPALVPSFARAGDIANIGTDSTSQFLITLQDVPWSIEVPATATNTSSTVAASAPTTTTVRTFPATTATSKRQAKGKKTKDSAKSHKLLVTLPQTPADPAAIATLIRNLPTSAPSPYESFQNIFRVDSSSSNQVASMTVSSAIVPPTIASSSNGPVTTNNTSAIVNHGTQTFSIVSALTAERLSLTTATVALAALHSMIEPQAQTIRAFGPVTPAEVFAFVSSLLAPGSTGSYYILDEAWASRILGFYNALFTPMAGNNDLLLPHLPPLETNFARRDIAHHLARMVQQRAQEGQEAQAQAQGFMTRVNQAEAAQIQAQQIREQQRAVQRAQQQPSTVQQARQQPSTVQQARQQPSTAQQASVPASGGGRPRRKIERTVNLPPGTAERPGFMGVGQTRHFVLVERDADRPGLEAPGMSCTEPGCPCSRQPWPTSGRLRIKPCAILCEVCGLFRGDFPISAGNLRRHVREHHLHVPLKPKARGRDGHRWPARLYDEVEEDRPGKSAAADDDDGEEGENKKKGKGKKGGEKKRKRE